MNIEHGPMRASGVTWSEISIEIQSQIAEFSYLRCYGRTFVLCEWNFWPNPTWISMLTNKRTSIELMKLLLWMCGRRQSFTAGDNVCRMALHPMPTPYIGFSLTSTSILSTIWFVRKSPVSRCSIFENDDLHRQPTCYIMRLKGFRWYIRQAVTH